MAYHNHTPESVLAAPPLRPRWFVRHNAPNRHDRRHGWTRTGARPFIVKARQIPALNLPYRKRKGWS